MTSRRAFLAGAVGSAALAGAAAAGCGSSGSSADRAAAAVVPTIEFYGRHQAGVVSRAPAGGVVAAFDVRATDRRELAGTLRTLSAEAARIMAGEPVAARDGGFPPDDSGLLGADPGATETSVIVGFGASLFDDRFGLTDRIPAELQPMPRFANDRMVTAERSGGDLSLTVSAGSPDAALYGFRQLMRVSRGQLSLRWMREGFNTIDPAAGPGQAPVRNLMGFKDGTANPDHTSPADMDRFVWVQESDGHPDWAVGGTYQAIRVIRMMVEFWDRTRLSEQEGLLGRHKISGAPLGQRLETDDPRFTNDPASDAISDDAHIRRANPRTADVAEDRILRRGFSYSAGMDDVDNLDMGLLFTSFQRSLERGFIATQRRLDGEALEEYIRPLGGGFFFVPPGVAAPGGYLGEDLLV